MIDSKGQQSDPSPVQQRHRQQQQQQQVQQKHLAHQPGGGDASPASRQGCAAAATGTACRQAPHTAFQRSVHCPVPTSAHLSSLHMDLDEPQAGPAGAAVPEAAQVAASQDAQTGGVAAAGVRQPSTESMSQSHEQGQCIMDSIQHVRPRSLQIDDGHNEAGTPAAGSGPSEAEGQQDQPCTPGPQQGALQDQPCTPGLVSTSSACCVLPRSCSSTGEDSVGSGLEAENSIRFRKRSKFEALKARRDEARQKAEVSHITPVNRPLLMQLLDS